MLIAIEGIDGVGKATQVQKLKERASRLGMTVGSISFPRYNQTFFSDFIGHYLNGKLGNLQSLNPIWPALLYAADRLESRNEIIRLCKSHDIVILDRYVASNMAYQAARVSREDRQDFIRKLYVMEYDIFKLPRADLTVVLDIPVELASEMIRKKPARIYTAEAVDMHEKDPIYLSDCREVYQKLVNMNLGGAWVSIECVGFDGRMLSADIICDGIWNHIEATAHANFNPMAQYGFIKNITEDLTNYPTVLDP